MKLGYIYFSLLIGALYILTPQKVWGQYTPDEKPLIKLRLDVGVGKAGRDLDFDTIAIVPTFTVAYVCNDFMEIGAGGGIYHDDISVGLAFFNARVYLAKKTYDRIRPYADVKIGYGMGSSPEDTDDLYHVSSVFDDDKYIFADGYSSFNTKNKHESVRKRIVDGMHVTEYYYRKEGDFNRHGLMGIASLGFEFRNGFYFGATYALTTGSHAVTTRKVWEFEDGTVYVGDVRKTKTLQSTNALVAHIGWNICILKTKREDI